MADDRCLEHDKRLEHDRQLEGLCCASNLSHSIYSEENDRVAAEACRSGGV